MKGILTIYENILNFIAVLFTIQTFQWGPHPNISLRAILCQSHNISMTFDIVCFQILCSLGTTDHPETNTTKIQISLNEVTRNGDGYEPLKMHACPQEHVYRQFLLLSTFCHGVWQKWHDDLSMYVMTGCLGESITKTTCESPVIVHLSRLPHIVLCPETLLRLTNSNSVLTCMFIHVYATHLPTLILKTDTVSYPLNFHA